MSALRRLDYDEREQSLLIIFPYAPELLPTVRDLPERRWHPDRKLWSVPERHFDEVRARLVPLGFVLAPALAVRSSKASVPTELASVVPTGDGVVAAPRVADATGPRALSPSSANLERAQSAPLSDQEPFPASPSASALTVSALNERVRTALQRSFPATFWLVGEVMGFDRNAHKKHIYFQLAEKADGDDRPRAVVTAVLFERTKNDVAARLKSSADGLELRDGLRVLMRVRVDLYVAQGSYQIVVEDIDPDFALGEIARRRERILAEVERLGLRAQNLERVFPEPCLRVGLITSVGSDAYNDFLNELEISGFSFEVSVYDAHVQGAQVEADVTRALEWFAARAGDFDSLAIVRGGGARAELMSFDTLPLALAVARHPLKIVIGIGHHRDRGVLDYLAHSEKTPTAVAQQFVALAQAQMESRCEAARALAHLSGALLAGARELLARRSQLITRTLQMRLVESHSRLAAIASRARLGVDRCLERRRASIERSGATLLQAAARRAERGHDGLLVALRRLPQAIRVVVERTRERLEARELRLRAADPARVLQRGYAWLRRAEGGRTIARVADVAAGDAVVARLADGDLDMRVNAVRAADPLP
ncbi:MAG: exodeoxyribonuclease VII large subunit [Planctomycetota bacterium]